MSSDLRNRILGLNKKRIISAEIPGLGTVYFRALQELARAQLETALEDPAAVKRAVIIKTLCDEYGTLLLTDDDFDRLGEVDSAIIDKISGAALKLNDFTAEDIGKMLGEPASC